MKENDMIVPVILSGGAGTRLWPMSTSQMPKQFLRLTGANTLFEKTIRRVEDSSSFAQPIVVGSLEHLELLRSLTINGTIICEPTARNTGPAIALAALQLDPNDIMLVMPSDHQIEDLASFHRAVELGAKAAERGYLVTLGVTPTGPETGFGYIKMGEPIKDVHHAYLVEKFIEKPDRDVALNMLNQGNHLWNAGIFIFQAKRLIAEFENHEPDMLKAVDKAMTLANISENVIVPSAEAFAAARPISIDYAIMEKSDSVACVPVSMGWSDVGSWDSIFDFAKKDSNNNLIIGDVVHVDCTESLIRASGIKVAALGVRNLVVIATDDAVLIVPRGESQRVKDLISKGKIKI